MTLRDRFRALSFTRGLMCTVVLAGGFAVVGCAARTGAAAAPSHDAPVPASEPRAELAVELELAPSPDCEERFDLALYEEAGVELVAWDAAAGECRGRSATIRYFPQRIGKDALLARVRGLAVEAREGTREGAREGTGEGAVAAD